MEERMKEHFEDYLKLLPEVDRIYKLEFSRKNPSNVPFMKVIGFIYEDKLFSTKEALIDQIMENWANEDELEYLTAAIEVIHRWEKKMKSGNVITDTKKQIADWWIRNRDPLCEDVWDITDTFGDGPRTINPTILDGHGK